MATVAPRVPWGTPRDPSDQRPSGLWIGSINHHYFGIYLLSIYHSWMAPPSPVTSRSRLPACLWAQRSVPPTPSISHPPVGSSDIEPKHWEITGTFCVTQSSRLNNPGGRKHRKHTQLYCSLLRCRCLPVYGVKFTRLNSLEVDFWPFRPSGRRVPWVQPLNPFGSYRASTLGQANMTTYYSVNPCKSQMLCMV